MAAAMGVEVTQAPSVPLANSLRPCTMVEARGTTGGPPVCQHCLQLHGGPEESQKQHCSRSDAPEEPEAVRR